MNQIAKSGSSFLDARPTGQGGVSKQCPVSKATLAVMLSLSLFLVGSCNERANFLDFSSAQPNLSEMSKAELLRHAYAVQASLMSAPQYINKLRAEDIKLAMAAPDLSRQEGKARVWQYRTGSCVLDIHWQDKGAQKVIYHEFRARQRISIEEVREKEKPAAWTCIQNIIDERRAAIDKTFEEIYAVLSLNAQRS